MGTIRSDQIIATVSALLSVVLFIVGGEYLIGMNPIHAQEHGPIAELRRINAAGYHSNLHTLLHGVSANIISRKGALTYPETACERGFFSFAVTVYFGTASC